MASAATNNNEVFRNSFEPRTTTGKVTPATASRFLSQATFGQTASGIDDLVALGSFESWIDAQVAAPASWQEPAMRAINSAMCGNADTGDHLARHQAWWDAVLNGPDQLRLRVAFALSQMLVVSDSHQTLNVSHQFGLAAYYDVLMHHAFGNYRDLLGEVATHPTMGVFLSMVKNERADPMRNVHPDENFAREVLQLFSIGVHELDLGGQLLTDSSGQPIDTYDQTLIQAFARVFTGWNFDGTHYWWENSSLTTAMAPWEESHPVDPAIYHDGDAKTLLGGTVNAAGLSAHDDLNAALDNIFAHPNVGPFVSKRLIQHFVTSNPSSDYVRRVAAVFSNNGQGERGDMEAVIRAILLDDAARREYGDSDAFGKLREPVLRFSHLWRAVGLNPVQYDGSTTCDTGGQYSIYQVPWWLGDFEKQVGQQVLSAPSVFSFFSPTFAPQGQLRDAGLLGPEFQLVTDSLMLNTANAANVLIHEPNQSYSAFDFDDEAALAADPRALVEYLSLVFLNQRMSNPLRQALVDHLTNAEAFPDESDSNLARARDAVTLIVNSPEYLIRK